MDTKETRFFKNFGATVRRIRLEREMTLEDMQTYGFSAQHFQKLESGKKSIGLYTAQRIAKVFDMPLVELIKKTES